MIATVRIASSARKDLRRVPSHILRKLLGWVETVELLGLEETRKILGFHDEPLQGERSGQRSIRLNRSYRALYELRCTSNDARDHVLIVEVNKHDY